MTAGLIPEDRLTVTVDEAAALLGISRTLAFQAARAATCQRSGYGAGF
jgi:hypothetical protein